MLAVERMTGISAEAAATLGSMRGTFPALSQGLLVEPSLTLGACERVFSGMRSGTGPWEPLPTGGFALLLREVDVSGESATLTATDGLIRDILSAPESIREHLSPLREVLRRLLTEALLNVHEHAYAKGAPAKAWVSVVCLPAMSARSLYQIDSMLASEERSFLKSLGEKQVLELAVADAGFGIPRSLALAAEKLLPALADKVRGVSSARRSHEEARAQMHAGLCYYGFDHDSTSRNETNKKFRTPEHALNWRGLYRCYRQVAELGGGITVTSGRGRSGYLRAGDGVQAFHVVLPGRTDLPGTLLTVRLPLPVRPRPAPPAIFAPEGTPIELKGGVIRWDRLHAENPSTATRNGSVRSSLEFVAVALPFMELVRDEEQAAESRLPLRQIRLALKRLELHCVPVFCFARLPEAWQDSLRAFVADENWHSAFDGPPRLLGFLSPDESIRWVFAGAIPQEAQPALQRFEEEGRWQMPKGARDIIEKLFTELRAHHAGTIQWNQKSREFLLLPHRGTLSGQDYARVVETAFAQYWDRADVKKEVLTEVSGKVILLPTGTCVRRHFSVFKMLNQSPALSTALSRAFAHHLSEVFHGERITLVLDQPASRFIAHALLEGANCESEIYTLDEFARRLPAARSVVLFADTIFKGDTACRAIDEIRSLRYRVALVVAAADLRPERNKRHLQNVPFTALVSPEDFSAEVVPDPGDMEKIQTDSITNVPLLDAASTFIEIAEHEGRRSLLKEHPELFCAGFHVRSGRTHTIALPLSRILDLEGGDERLAEWLTETVVSALERIGRLMKEHDVVLFSWFDSRVGNVVERVAARLREPELGASGVFSVRMPVIYRGSDMIYPRAGSDPLSGCAEITTGRFPFAGRRRPNEKYIAVYLADSAVTGNSLREFLHRVGTAAMPAASAVVAVVGVNRLNPAEVRFFDLCPELCGTNRPHLSFAFDYLFSLQIRSRAGEGPIWNHLFEAILGDPALRIAELREYIDQLRRRTERLNSKEPLLHLFCPDAQPLTVTAEVVRFRHLLALNQQNEPVVLEIVALLHQLTNELTEDSTLLNILALEPALLLDPPLRQFGREAILQLARRVLKSEASLPLKSDALAVIAGFPGGLRQMLHGIAPQVFAEPVLRRQLAALLLVQQRQLPDSASTLVQTCFQTLDLEAQRHAEHLLQIVTVSTEIQRAHREPARDLYFREVIEKLGSHMLHHSETLETEWDGVNFQLFSLIEEWDTRGVLARKTETIETLRRARVFAEKILLPAFSALAYFAGGQGQAKLAEVLVDGEVKARELLSSLEHRLPNDNRGPGKEQVRSLMKAFQRLQEATWLAPSAERLGRPEFSTAKGPLPLALFQTFSSPPDLLFHLAEEMLGSASAFSKIGAFSSSANPHQLTVCPVPTHTLSYIFSLLLTNIKKHGITAGLNVQIPPNYPHSASDGTHSWAVEIINPLGKEHNGKGHGLEVARTSVVQYGIKIESDELVPKETWRTLVTIPHCFFFRRIHDAQPL